MGLVKAELTLRNPLDDRLDPYIAHALVDTGAMMLCIPEHVATQLQLQQIQVREVTTADGRRHACPYVGPVEIAFKNRVCFQGAPWSSAMKYFSCNPGCRSDVVITPSRRDDRTSIRKANMPMSIAKASRSVG